MDSLTLRAVVAELVPYRGLRVDAVTSADPWELHLELEKGVALVACVHPDHNAFYPAPTDRLESGTAPLPFARAVEKTLAGSRFAGARQAGLDRTAALAFDRRDRLGDTRRVQLLVELTGKGGNLILVEGGEPFTGKILDRLREDRSRRSPRRIAPGAPYQPSPAGKADVDQVSPDALAQALETKAEGRPVGARELVQAWMGVSPASADEILRSAGAAPDAAALARSWVALAAGVRPATGGNEAGTAFSPTLVVGADGTGQVFCFAPTATEAGSEAKRTSYPTASAAVSAAHRIFRQRQNSPHHALHRPVRLALDRTLRALATLDREEEEAKDAPRWRQLGEAILASAHEMTRGAEVTELANPHGGETLVVKLDPTLGPGENAEQYFKRAKKAERAGAKVDRRRHELVKRREALEALVRDLSDAAGPDPAWYERALKLGVKVPREDIPESAGTADDGLTSALRPRRYDLGGGWQALVGKSNRGNEVLTHEIARPHETWMHADQASGSHLVLRHDEKGKEPPLEVLLAAAAIAAFFSKARGAGKVPVLISEKRHVRRPRKAPIGTVTVGRHKTVMVAPSDPDQRKKR